MLESVGSSTSGIAGLGVSGGGGEDLRTEFLELLLTQMKNQDPLSPMDSSGMMQQLATFSQLEQLQQVNANLEDLGIYSQSLNNTMMMNLVGRRVTVLGNHMTMDAGTPSRMMVRALERGIGTAEIVDSTGSVVRKIAEFPVDPGFTQIPFDGLDDHGEPLADGEYTVRVNILNSDGNKQNAALFESGVVDTIQFDNGINYLIVNGRVFSPAEIVEVGLAHEASKASASRYFLPSPQSV